MFNLKKKRCFLCRKPIDKNFAIIILKTLEGNQNINVCAKCADDVDKFEIKDLNYKEDDDESV